VIIILLSATSIIAFANVLKLPIATSHAMVGAVIGIGIFYQSVAWGKVGVIIIWWLVTPIMSLTLSYLIGRYLYQGMDRWVKGLPGQGVVRILFRIFITLSGCYIAFSAGSNSLAKAVGPVVGAGILTTNHAAVMGGLGMAAGALLVGQRLLHTVGKGITPIDPLKATLVELICGTILLIASHFGIPISLAETITCSVIGFGAAHGGIRQTLENEHVSRIYKLWPACPFISALTSFLLAWVLHYSGICQLR
jgi:PiT family inorganic phosphate transporter/sulfate permease